MYLSNQKTVVTRQWNGHRGQVDFSGLAISDSLETTPYEARNLESIHILQPHQPLSSPLEVFQFRKIWFFRLVTRPEGWTAEGQKVNLGGWVTTEEKSGCYHQQMCLWRGREPTLCVLHGFVTVDDVQPLWMQPLDQSEGYQRVCHCRCRDFVKFSVQVGHFGIKAVGNNMVCGYEKK